MSIVRTADELYDDAERLAAALTRTFTQIERTEGSDMFWFTEHTRTVTRMLSVHLQARALAARPSRTVTRVRPVKPRARETGLKVREITVREAQ